MMIQQLEATDLSVMTKNTEIDALLFEGQDSDDDEVPGSIVDLDDMVFEIEDSVSEIGDLDDTSEVIEVDTGDEVPLDGQIPGYYTQGKLEELCDISEDDMVLAFGEEEVKLYTGDSIVDLTTSFDVDELSDLLMED